ncbi:MAG TPA: hypothetical protein VMU71_07085 [Terracidiphilus sp.]|nr:hypothetical protein [Terracidiphilus sp.]
MATTTGSGLLGCAAVLAALFCFRSLNAQIIQDLPEEPQPHRSGIHFSMSGGAALALGKTPVTMNTGAAMVFGPSFGGRGRWSLPLNVYLVVSYPPAPILAQANDDSGMLTLLGFAADPMFTFLGRGRWGAYASAGGGISVKEVRFWHGSSGCDTYDGCFPPTAQESSWQPMMDASAGVTWLLRPGIPGQLYAELRLVDMFTPSGLFPGFDTAGTRLLLPQMGFRF